MKILQKIAAVICAVAVTATMTSPISVGNGFNDGVNYFAGSAAAQADEEKPMSGKCGDNLTWVLDDEGILTISGTGDMYDYPSYTSSPWRYRDDVKSAVIEYGVTGIGDYCFDHCKELKSITIPNSVEEIRAYSFNGCSGLISVTIPDSVTQIYTPAFSGCDSLKMINVNPDNTYFYSVDGVLFHRSKALFRFPPANDQRYFQIPNGISEISSSAFSGCNHLISITISDGVSKIGQNAFNGCKYLSNITIPNSVGWIDPVAFSFCISLTSVTIPDSVTYIPHQAFSGCSSLASVTIPNSVTNIGSYAFLGCSSITDVYYTGSKEQWKEIKIENYNECLTNATIHYNSTGSDSVTDMVGNIRFLCSYNSETGKVRFDESSTHIGLDYALSDTIDKSAIPSMLNKYVLAEVDTSTNTVINLKPVESKIGTISSIDKTASTITIDGEVYPLSRDNSVLTLFADQQIGKTVLFHTYNNTIVAMNSIEEKTGKLESWDYTAQELTIDGKSYPTNFLTDISFLAHVNELFEKKVLFTSVDGGSYTPILKVEASTENDPLEPDSPDPTPTHITVPFREQDMDIVWNDNLFSHSPYEYDNNLAIAALALSGAAESKTSDEVETVLQKMGFESGILKKYGESNPMQPAYAFATKKITIDGKEKTLVCITVRGSTSAEDWLCSDFIDGATAGFSASTKFLCEELLEYLTGSALVSVNRDDMIFFITGHSLGGAVASNLTAYLIDNKVVNQENIYAYTFAPPNYFHSAIKSYDNLFEIINTDDIVPRVGFGTHFGERKYFYPVAVGTKFYSYWNLWNDGVLIPVDKVNNHLVPAYMAFLLTQADFTQIKPIAEKSYFISVRCPVDVEIYDANDTLIAKVTNNKIDESVTSDGVFCKIEGDEKYFFVESDKEIYTRLTGTDSGTMEYSVQKLTAVDEAATEDNFVTYKNVVLEKGKEFYSDITEKNGNADVSLYVVDTETKQPIKTVELDGTEVPISLENTYKITFDANGGTSSATNLATDTNGKLTSLPTAARTDYTFDGWFTAAENGKKITTDTVFTENTTVYAHWTNSGNSSGSTGGTSSGSTGGASSGSTGGTPSDSTGGSSSDSTSSDETPSSSPDGASTDSTEVESSDSNNDTSFDSSDSSSSDGMSSNSDETFDSDSFSASGESSKNSNGSSNDNPGNPSDNPPTGVSVAIIPLLLAAGASIVIFHKKSKK